MGDELALPSADGEGGSEEDLQIEVCVNFEVYFGCCYFILVPQNKWFGYQLPTITPQIGRKCSKLSTISVHCPI